MSNKMKVLVLHHSHTDIGYTDRQEKIEWHHVKYIERVIDILNEGFIGGNEKYKGFKWVCESYWCVERFLEQTTEKYKADFAKYVNQGNISISANYLNCTDILDEGVLRQTLAMNKAEMDKLSIKTECAMTADINGYGWGYPDALLDNGVTNLISCLHTHHGYYASNKKQRPFYWETPTGRKILVWHAEHYNIGNELNLNNSLQRSYMIRDGLADTGIENFELSTRRMFRYVEQLRADGYPYDFLPITVSGLMTDNSPPNEIILDFIHKWNNLYGDKIELEMASLQELFDLVRASDVPIETQSGDWTDWWADGVGSTPSVIKHYREAVRKYNIVRELDPEYKIVSAELMEKARYNLMFYSEHTWGFSSSIYEPCNPQVNNLDMRKNLYAGIAHEAVSRCIDMLSAAYGETGYVLNRGFKFHVVNPNNYPVKTLAYDDLEIMFDHKYFDIVDEKSGEVVPYQHEMVARGHRFNFLVELVPHEKRTFKIVEKPELPARSAGMFADGGCDGVNDLERTYERDPEFVASPYRLETPFMKIDWKIGEGITEIIDKATGKSILRSDREFNPFTPVYEVTPFKKDHCNDRRDMGRNRKCMSTKRDYGKLNDVTVLAYGDIYSSVKLDYLLEGTTICEVILTAYRHTPTLEVSLRINKTSVWEPENLYLSLPFTAGNEEIFVDKLGCIIRPRIDQLPGACIDFYAIQNGIAYVGDKRSVLVATTDTTLISMGTILPHPIKLCGDKGTPNSDLVYSWIMNNFWETNFKASLAGFQEYSYTLRLSDSHSKDDCFKEIKAINQGIICFHSFE